MNLEFTKTEAYNMLMALNMVDAELRKQKSAIVDIGTADEASHIILQGFDMRHKQIIDLKNKIIKVQ